MQQMWQKKWNHICLKSCWTLNINIVNIKHSEMLPFHTVVSLFLKQRQPLYKISIYISIYLSINYRDMNLYSSTLYYQHHSNKRSRHDMITPGWMVWIIKWCFGLPIYPTIGSGSDSVMSKMDQTNWAGLNPSMCLPYPLWTAPGAARRARHLGASWKPL